MGWRAGGACGSPPHATWHLHSSGNIAAVDEGTTGEPQNHASVAGRKRGGKRSRITKRQMAEEVSFLYVATL